MLTFSWRVALRGPRNEKKNIVIVGQAPRLFGGALFAFRGVQALSAFQMWETVVARIDLSKVNDIPRGLRRTTMLCLPRADRGDQGQTARLGGSCSARARTFALPVRVKTRTKLEPK